MEAGTVSRGERAKGPEELGDVPAAQSEDGREEEDNEVEESRPAKGRGQGIDQLTCRAWQSVVGIAQLASRRGGLAGLPVLELSAVGLGEAFLRSLGYTGHGGLLDWIRDQTHPSFHQGGSPLNSCKKRQKWN